MFVRWGFKLQLVVNTRPWERLYLTRRLAAALSAAALNPGGPGAMLGLLAALDAAGGAAEVGCGELNYHWAHLIRSRPVWSQFLYCDAIAALRLRRQQSAFQVSS